MSAKKTSGRQHRTEQKAQIEEVINVLKGHLQQNKESEKRLVLLDSVSKGLYDEIDKLSKKAPAEMLTDLALEQINDVIRETKQLIDFDPYIQRLNEFVAAGDNPQHRDALLVLRQIRQGLERYSVKLKSLINIVSSHLRDARGIHIAIQLDLAGYSPVSQEDIKENEADVSQSWLSRDFPRMFNFDKLDRININEYFTEANLT